MRICVVGTGYVGLVAGVGFSDFGNDVTCVDVDQSKIDMLRAGRCPIYEPGLEALLERNTEAGRLHFSTDLATAVSETDVVFIAVGTPPSPDGSADLSQVWQVARTVAEHATGFTVVVTKSTVPVGTADRIKRILNEAAPDKDLAVVSNPEFLKEGDAINDFMKPARVVIGADDDRARELMRYLYSPFVRTIDRVITMDPRSAEVTKYACNAMLASRISFMNEIARLCAAVEADVSQVRQAMAWDDRIGSRFLFPGAGFGGSCFPKDIRALISTAEENRVPLEVLAAVERVNQRQKLLLAELVVERLGQDLAGKRIALWGLAFKPQTDDVREAPALVIARDLLDRGATLRLHDPVAAENFSRELAPSESVEYCADNYEAVQQADALLLVTEWRSYRRPDFRRLHELMRTPNLFDGRNIWDPSHVRKHGFYYLGIGRS
jgi:UDPglucose 6-dehydrogenase